MDRISKSDPRLTSQNGIHVAFKRLKLNFWPDQTLDISQTTVDCWVGEADESSTQETCWSNTLCSDKNGGKGYRWFYIEIARLKPQKTKKHELCCHFNHRKPSTGFAVTLSTENPKHGFAVTLRTENQSTRFTVA
jgi:hypothetical protein